MEGLEGRLTHIGMKNNIAGPSNGQAPSLS